MVTRSAVERRTLQCLLKNEVGTFELEATALAINAKGSKKPKGSKINIRTIQQMRNKDKVKDLIRLRIKYVPERENALRGEYRRLRGQV